MAEQTTYRILEIIRPGIRVQYRDRDGAWHSEVVVKRRGGELTVRNALGVRRRIGIEQVEGYWPPRCRASTLNLVRLKAARQKAFFRR